MRVLDQVESFAFHADFPGNRAAVAAVFGNHQTGEYRLAPVDEKSLQVEIATLRGLHFVGVLGFHEGIPGIALYEPIDPATTARLTTEFVARFVRSLKSHPAAVTEPRLIGDSVAFLDRLYQLHDGRD